MAAIDQEDNAQWDNDQWQSFDQTGNAVSHSRQLLLAQAQRQIAESDVVLPVRKFIAIVPHGDAHVCGANLEAQMFNARTREGALVAYYDWMNKNFPANRRARHAPYDHFSEAVGGPASMATNVDNMFNQEFAKVHDLTYLREILAETTDHYSPDAQLSTVKAASAT